MESTVAADLLFRAQRAYVNGATGLQLVVPLIYRLGDR